MEFIIIMIVQILFVQGDEWSFSGEIGLGPERWFEKYPKCGASSRKQSPINIPAETVYDENLTPFRFHGYDSLGPDDLEIVNLGWTVAVNIKNYTENKANFTDGGFQDTYTAIQLHFHWGLNDTDKSGHTVHRRRFPLELHVVHYKAEYQTPEEALKHNGGIVLLAYVFEISENDNTNLEPYIELLRNVSHKGDKAQFGTPFSQFMGQNKADYYRYNGSKGEPDCDETIEWILFKDKDSVSHDQLEKLRQVYMTTKDASDPYQLTFNHRPLQALNSREVRRSFRTESGSAIRNGFGWLLFILLTITRVII